MAAPERPVVEKIGLTVLYEPPEGVRTIADLCFVHGLGGHPQKTWSYGKPPKNKPGKSGWRERLSFRKRETNSNSRPNGQAAENSLDAQNVQSTPGSGLQATLSQKTSSHCYWPFDLVPKEFPNVRVLSYGYDSNPTHFYIHKTTQLTISQHSLDLLSKVTNSRTRAPGRPLIFVAHSLGGIIVKDMIIESSKHKAQPNMRDAAESLRAILFFGTPHLGAASAEWGQILANLVNVIGMSTYKSVLRGLSPDSEKLAGVTRDFNDILDEHSAGPTKIYIYNFQEGRPLTSLKFFDGKVVPNTSSWLNRRTIERVSMIQDADHLSMCRFKSANDAGFKDFKAALESYLPTDRYGQGVASEREEAPLTQQELDFLQSFDFTDRLVRAQQIDQVRTFKETFEWIWSSNLIEWLQDDQPIFWIRGYPASGKSTLINHLMWNKQVRSTISGSHHGEWTMIYHFFDFRAGNGIANNFDGFMQSVLIQIFDSVPRLRNTATSQYHRKTRPTQNHVWSSSELEQLLEMVCTDGDLCFCLFVDGLDEYSGSMVEIVRFIEQISSAKRKVCIASRPDPPLPDAFRDVPQLMMHYVNRSGIEAFASTTLFPYLDTRISSQRAATEQLASTVVDRARGVFLWARFAVLQVIEGLTRGESIAALQRRLEDMPKQLTEIYARILGRRSTADKLTLSLMLKFVTSAFAPLAVEELYLALGFEKQPDTKIKLWMKEFDRKRFTKTINAVSGSLLEVVVVRERYKKPHVYLVRTIHRTVQTYLDEAGWNILEGHVDHPLLADELWLHVCVEALKVSRLSSLSEKDISFAKRRSSIDLSFPYPSLSDTAEPDVSTRLKPPAFDRFRRSSPEISIEGIRDYALAWLLDHAYRYEQLSKCSSYPKIGSIISQPDFTCLHLVAWMDGTCAKCEQLKSSEAFFESLPAIAVTHGLSLFIWDILRTDRFWTKMSCATLGKGKEREKSVLQSAKILALQRVNRCADASTVEILRMLLDIDPSLDDTDIANTIMYGTPASVRFVLQYLPPGPLTVQYSGQHPDTWSSRVGPLCLVTQHQCSDAEEILDIFLDRGENINSQCWPFGTALHSIVEHLYNSDNDAMVSLLVSRGADINVEGPTGRPLELYWREVNIWTTNPKYTYKRGEVIRCLIKHGAVNQL